MNKVLYIIFISLFALNINSCAKDEEHTTTTTTDTTSGTTSDTTSELFVTWGNS